MAKSTPNSQILTRYCNLKYPVCFMERVKRYINTDCKFNNLEQVRGSVKPGEVLKEKEQKIITA